jgi:hypothetical protein
LRDPEGEAEEANNAGYNCNQACQRWPLVDSGLAIAIVAHERVSSILAWQLGSGGVEEADGVIL